MTPEPTALALARLVPCLTLALSASPAMADSLPPKADLSLGAYVMVARTYDSDTDTVTDGPPKGEENACFQVVKHQSDGIILAQLTGSYQPWWSDKPIPPGSSDTWFTSDAWRENRPGAGILDELEVIFANVPNCKAPQS